MAELGFCGGGGKGLVVVEVGDTVKGGVRI